MKNTLRLLSALVLSLLVPCFIARAADTKPSTETKPAAAAAATAGAKELQGAWIPTAVEVNGETLSGDVMKDISEQRLTFADGGKGTIKKGTESLGEFTYTIEPDKSPKAFNLNLTKGDGEFKQYEGKKSRAIYELKGDSLKVCYTFFESDRARATEFKTAADSNLLMVTYKRDTK